MKTNNKLIALAIFALLASLAFGQVTMTSTTNSALISSTATSFVVGSATGITAPSFSTPNQPTGNQTLLVIDQEAMFVTGVNGTFVTVIRGFAKTNASAHASGATVWVGPPTAFADGDPGMGTSCLRTTMPYVPVVSLASGNTFDCLGLTTAGVIVRTNLPGVGATGTTVASATSITPTGTFFVVSGTTAVATIVVPAGFKPGMQLFINPSGIFATTTAGNIGLITSATVVGRILIMTWDGAHWWPSYVS